MPSDLPRTGAELTLAKPFDVVGSLRRGALAASSSSSLAIGVSVVAHIAIFTAAAVVHARPRGPIEALPIEIVIESEPPSPPAPPEPAPEEPLANRVQTPSPVAHSSFAPVHHDPATPPAKAEPSPEPPTSAPAALTGDAALPHFTLATSIAAPSGGTLAKSAGDALPTAEAAAGEGPYAEDAVDVPARATRAILPTYPAQARASGVEGIVRLEIVLSKDGAVETVRAVNHLGTASKKRRSPPRERRHSPPR